MREKKEINIQIGEQIKLAREAVKMTQEQMAERVGVSPQYVSDLERGVVGVSIATLKRICCTLGVTSDQILFGIREEDRFSWLFHRCKGLSEKQLHLLGEIINNFVVAIELEREK